MKTGSHLRIEEMGDNVLGVRLFGDPKKPEPIHFRICFPGGDLEIVRVSEGNEFWAHIRVNHPEDGWDPDRDFGKLVAARLDILGKSRADKGDFENPGLYHLAVKIGRINRPSPSTKPRRKGKG